MWTYDASREAVSDALRLSRAMTYKAAVADLALGGGKGVIMLPAGRPLNPAQRRAALFDFADTVEMLDGRYITAEDVGTSSRDMSAIATRTRFVAGLARRRGGSGDPSPWTALGVEAAIRASASASSAARARSSAASASSDWARRLAGCTPLARAGARLVLIRCRSAQALPPRLGARWIAPDRELEPRPMCSHPARWRGPRPNKRHRCSTSRPSRRRQQSARRGSCRRPARGARRPVGAGFRRQRRRDHQHLS